MSDEQSVPLVYEEELPVEDDADSEGKCTAGRNNDRDAGVNWCPSTYSITDRATAGL